ncbi:MAG: hypothetical protein J1E07_05220 [Treponema sp.]|nr:hypothetical protein [Treponema sp.]
MSNPLIFESERVISSAFIDSSVRMGVAQAVLLVQDNLTECFNALGCDGVVYRKDFGAFWVFTKTKVRFVRRPDWREVVTARTFPVDNAGMRTHVNTEILDKNGSRILTANQEACVLSLENHRPRRLAELPYPKDDFPAPVAQMDFSRFPSDFTEDEFVFEQKIRSCHIDMSRHMNNIEYIKFALSVFSDDFLQTHEVTDLEVHYTGESREDQTLRIYRRDVPCDFPDSPDSSAGLKTYIHIREENRCVFECCVEFAA